MCDLERDSPFPPSDGDRAGNKSYDLLLVGETEMRFLFAQDRLIL